MVQYLGNKTKGVKMELKNIEDCIKILKRRSPMKNPETLEFMHTKEEFVLGQYHHGFGTKIRNEWLWDIEKQPLLIKFFHDYGIIHADDMSGLIIKAFWCSLNKVEFDIEEKVKSYIEFWKRQPDMEYTFKC